MRHHELHPEKTWIDARGPGFDSPQLHHLSHADAFIHGLIGGAGDSALDRRLSDELDKYNAAATSELEPAQELTVRIEDDGELVARGCTHVFVTSFTFQAPDFYQRHGYEGMFRRESVPRPDATTCTCARTSDDGGRNHRDRADVAQPCRR